MNTKELRIGSFYMVKFHDKWEEHRLDPFSICQAINNEIKIKPIPLTEDRLLEFGFKKEVLSDDSGYYYALEFNENKYCDLSICSGDEKGFIEAVLFPYEEWFRFKYVHELQNLFFAITGKELEPLKK